MDEANGRVIKIDSQKAECEHPHRAPLMSAMGHELWWCPECGAFARAQLTQNVIGGNVERKWSWVKPSRGGTLNVALPKSGIARV